MEWNPDRVLAVVGIGLGVVLAIVAIGVGLGMDTKTQGEFQFVQGSFILAALALSVPIIFWGVRSNAALSIRVPVIVLCSGLIALALVTGLRWSGNRHKDQNAPARAHLHITKFEWNAPLDVGGRARIKVIFENNGDAPTSKIAFCGHMGFFLLDEGTEKQRAFEQTMIANPPEISGTDISDNEMPAHVDRSFALQSSPWGQGAIDKFSTGRAVVYAAGILTYSDSNGTRKAKFCGYIAKDGEMKFCHLGSEEP